MANALLGAVTAAAGLQASKADVSALTAYALQSACGARQVLPLCSCKVFQGEGPLRRATLARRQGPDLHAVQVQRARRLLTVVRNVCLYQPNSRGFFGRKTLQNCIIFNPLNLSPVMSPLCHHSVFGAKSAENGELRKVRFSYPVSNVLPGPPNSLVFNFPRSCCAAGRMSRQPGARRGLSECPAGGD